MELISKIFCVTYMTNSEVPRYVVPSSVFNRHHTITTTMASWPDVSFWQKINCFSIVVFLFELYWVGRRVIWGYVIFLSIFSATEINYKKNSFMSLKNLYYLNKGQLFAHMHNFLIGQLILFCDSIMYFFMSKL